MVAAERGGTIGALDYERLGRVALTERVETEWQLLD